MIKESASLEGAGMPASEGLRLAPGVPSTALSVYLAFAAAVDGVRYILPRTTQAPR